MSSSTHDTPRRRPRKPIKTWQRVLFHWRLPLVIVLVLMVLSGVLVHTVSSRLDEQKQAKQKQADKAAEEMIT